MKNILELLVASISLFCLNSCGVVSAPAPGPTGNVPQKLQGKWKGVDTQAELAFSQNYFYQPVVANMKYKVVVKAKPGGGYTFYSKMPPLMTSWGSSDVMFSADGNMKVIFWTNKFGTKNRTPTVFKRVGDLRIPDMDKLIHAM